jgi:hypothetical protein
MGIISYVQGEWVQFLSWSTWHLRHKQYYFRIGHLRMLKHQHLIKYLNQSSLEAVLPVQLSHESNWIWYYLLCKKLSVPCRKVCISQFSKNRRLESIQFTPRCAICIVTQLVYWSMQFQIEVVYMVMKLLTCEAVKR